MNNIITYGNPATALTNAELYGGVKYSLDIFDGEQIELGATPSACIKFRCDRKINIDTELRYYDGSTLIGYFTVTDCKRDTATELYDITAYDGMIKFNADVSEWSRNLNLSTTNTLKKLFGSLANYIGYRLENLNWVFNGTNSDFAITSKTWSDDNLTGRIMLKYIAQMAGGYAIMSNRTTQSNVIAINSISSFTTETITNNAWKKRTIAEYTCPVIDKVWVGAEDGDVGYTSGTGSNALKITANPLFYGDNTQAIQTAVDNIYTAVHAISAYSPVEIELFEPVFDVNIWQRLFKLNSTKNNVTTTSIITNIYWDNSGVKYTSKGLANRDAVRNYVDNKTYETNAKYNKLTRDINETKSEIANLDGDVSTLTQTVNGLTVTVSKKISTYSQAAEPTEKSSGDLWYFTGTTTSTMTNGKWYRWNGSTWVEVTDSEIDTNASNISTLQQTATSLTSRITNAEGDINEIEQTMEGVAFKSSLADGTTVINGGCIQTGTIDADKANIINLTAGDITMTGQLAWSDFSAATQSRIDQGKNDYGDNDVKSYLTSKYSITSTTANESQIVSPHIIGGLIEGDELVVYDQYTAKYNIGNNEYTAGYIGANGTVSPSDYSYVEMSNTDNTARVVVGNVGGSTRAVLEASNGSDTATVYTVATNNTSSINLEAEYIYNNGGVVLAKASEGYDGYAYGTLAQMNNYPNPEQGQLFFVI